MLPAEFLALQVRDGSVIQEQIRSGDSFRFLACAVIAQIQDKLLGPLFLHALMPVAISWELPFMKVSA